MVAQGSLWEHPGRPEGPQSAQDMSILHKYFAHRFLRASWPALWPKLGQNYMPKTVFRLPGASGSHVGHFTKNLPGDNSFEGFWCHFGWQIEPLGSLWAPDGTFFRCGVQSHCRVYGDCRTSAGRQIRSEGKVYLSDKAYD